jgi:hypothetical protein
VCRASGNRRRSRSRYASVWSRRRGRGADRAAAAATSGPSSRTCLS